MNLRLLIDRQHHRMIWRVQIKTHHVPDLFDENGVGRDLEAPGPMRLERKDLKNPVNSGLRKSVRFGRQPDTPMRRTGRILLEGPALQNGDLFVGHQAWATWTKLVVKGLADDAPQNAGATCPRSVSTSSDARRSPDWRRPRQPQHQMDAGYKSTRQTARSGKDGEPKPIFRGSLAPRKKTRTNARRARAFCSWPW